MKKKTINKVIFIATLILSSVLTPIPIRAASVRSDNWVYRLYEESEKRYSIISYFNPSHKIIKGEGWDLKPGKYVRRAYVRARADGLIVLKVKVCSGYDSGRLYSAKAPLHKKTIYATPLASVKIAVLCSKD